MAKLILFEDEARQALKNGIDVVANAVKTTLGPRGRNVAIQRGQQVPMVTHDGVTVAKDIELRNPFENMGAQLIKTAALRTNEVAGDGTTTATVLAQAIVSEGLHAMASGANPMLIKRGLDDGVEQVIKYFRTMSRPLEGHDDIAHVASISAADTEIGGVIADLMDKVGKDGVITVEESHTIGITTEYQEGLDYDQGFLSPFFITDEARQEAVLEDALVLLTGLKVEKIAQLIPILQRVLNGNEKSLFIIADDVDGEALSTLVLTKLHGQLNLLATKPPGYGDRRKLELEDIAALTGATVITEESGQPLDSVTIKQLGRARRIVSTKDRTVITGGYGSESAIQDRLRSLRLVLADIAADYDQEWLKKRIARLSNGIGVIRVGASTKVESEERKMRVEDALAATRSAVSEGILPGGGVAYLNAARALGDYHLPGDMGIGVAILRRALEEPVRLLARNAGQSSPVVVDEIRRAQLAADNLNVGYNVMDQSYVNLIDTGVIDPTRVARIALENAVSVASLVLTAEALVAEPYEPPKPPTTNRRRGF